ncbi:MAG: CBS domain-containing protein [Candidatus Bathyarchaeia archaeon]
MVKVRDVMSTDVPRVDYSTTVLEACTIMNSTKFSGVIVVHNGKAVGMLTDRSLLRRFVVLNKRSDEVKVGDVMAPLLKVDAGASTKEAAKIIVQNNFTRLAVFDGDKCLGWVSLTDLAREASKKHLLDALLRHNAPETDEFLCPKCRKAILEKTTGWLVDERREIVGGWECPNCHYAT